MNDFETRSLSVCDLFYIFVKKGDRVSTECFSEEVDIFRLVQLKIQKINCGRKGFCVVHTQDEWYSGLDKNYACRTKCSEVQ